MRLFLTVFLLVAPVFGQTRESGEINGAQYLIEMPETWNGTLLVYCHGYSGSPGRFDGEKPSAFSVLTQAGAAVFRQPSQGGVIASAASC